MGKKRLYSFDNAKFILISLVLIGHFLEPVLQENILAGSFYIFIYSFHMPAFIFIAGYFSKLNSEIKVYLIKNIRRLLIPYFIFQFLYRTFNALLNNYPLNFYFKKPFWILWFLLSLFFWRMMLVIIDRFEISALTIFAAAIFAALLVGFTGEFDRFYSGSRTVVFFPFFILGYYFRKYSLAVRYKKIYDYLSRKFVIFIYAVEIIIIYMFLHNIDLEILYGAISYYRLELSLNQALLSRTFFLLTSLFNIFLFFKLVPTKRTVISQRGARSIYPYLLHGFIVILIDKYDLLYFLNSYLSFFIYFLLALFFSWILSAKRTRNIFKYILEF